MTTIVATPAYANDSLYGGTDVELYNDTNLTAAGNFTAQNTILTLPSDAWSGSGTTFKLLWYKMSGSTGTLAGYSTFVAADGTGVVSKALNSTFAVSNGDTLRPGFVSDGFCKVNADSVTFATFNPTGTFASPAASINTATDGTSSRAKIGATLDGTAAGDTLMAQACL